MNTSVCDAIRVRAVITFDYDGGARTAEPHLHGVSTAGNDVLCAWQTGGYSRSGQSSGWKLFRIEEMSDVVMTDQRFTGSRPGYNPEDSRMTMIHCRV